MRVAIADDSALLRQGLGRLLADDGWQVTASVGDGTALLRAIDTDPPDAVIVDIRMPPTQTDEGLVAARTIPSSGRGSGGAVERPRGRGALDGGAGSGDCHELLDPSRGTPEWPVRQIVINRGIAERPGGCRVLAESTWVRATTRSGAQRRVG